MNRKEIQKKFKHGTPLVVRCPAGVNLVINQANADQLVISRHEDYPDDYVFRYLDEEFIWHDPWHVLDAIEDGRLEFWN